MLKRLVTLVCMTLPGWTAEDEVPHSVEPPGLIIYHAGSLSAALKAVEDLYTQRTGIRILNVAGGSVSLARQVTAGRERCDIYAGADVEVIDRLLKPAGFADFSVRIAQGAMVLAYSTASKQAGTIAATGGRFDPPHAIPDAAPDWYLQLIQPGVTIVGSHPFLDPGAYRADLIFQLAADRYCVPNLYNDLLAHYVIARVPGGLGKAFDYQFTYEHSARAASKADQTRTYRYLRLPDEVNLGAPGLNPLYAKRSVTIPGLQLSETTPTVSIPGGQVTWGLTLMKAAPNRANAVTFLQLLFSSQGAALMNTVGPSPISPPRVSKQDFARLPAALKSLVETE